ncbi:hypothetical protein [Sphaerisporangium aureirubrum]|uniref:Uncharacterized protein n=1 Tax=Sphaerisporangium aureirubrum TaxID=1544736 RepID=A0ABW1NDS8_9ACTN
MDEPRPPVVWIPTYRHGAGLIAWLSHDGEWWAHLVWVKTNPKARYKEPDFVRFEACLPATMIIPRTGYDYSRVPRYKV